MDHSTEKLNFLGDNPKNYIVFIFVLWLLTLFNFNQFILLMLSELLYDDLNFDDKSS